MARARAWLAEHPSTWVCVLEGGARGLNALLIAAALAAVAFAAATAVQIRQAGAPPLLAAGDASALLPPPPRGEAGLAAAPPADLAGAPVPWFIYASGAVGAGTAVAGAAALVGASLRSVGWVSLNVVLVCIALTAQACVGVAAAIDHSWERRLPPTAGPAARAWLAQRLLAVKWGGAGLFLGQLAALLLACGLQSAYVAAEEAAEDEEDDAAAAGAGGGGAAEEEAAAWRARMEQRYGLDPALFGEGAAAAGTGGGGGGEDGGGRRCAVM